MDAGISDLWAKSVSQKHARILQRIGAHHIINAETDAGKRVGHLVAGNYLDYIEIDGPYNVVKIHTPLYAVGRNILLHGVLQGQRINGSSLEIRPLRSAMFTRFDMLKYEGGSSASHIDVNKIEAHRLTCRTLQAGTAILCDNSMVEHAICSTSIGLDRTSCVMLVKGLLAQCRIAHNAMLAESLPTDFKLRLDQQHHLSAGSGDARNHRNHIGQ